MSIIKYIKNYIEHILTNRYHIIVLFFLFLSLLNLKFIQKELTSSNENIVNEAIFIINLLIFSIILLHLLRLFYMIFILFKIAKNIKNNKISKMELGLFSIKQFSKKYKINARESYIALEFLRILGFVKKTHSNKGFFKFDYQIRKN